MRTVLFGSSYLTKIVWQKSQSLFASSDVLLLFAAPNTLVRLSLFLLSVLDSAVAAAAVVVVAADPAACSPVAALVVRDAAG